MKFFLVLANFFSISLVVYSQNIYFDPFSADTFRIEQEARDKYNSTNIIIESEYLLQEYDKLLNKYYQELYAILDDVGKKTLKITQLNWLKLRDSDFLFIKAISIQGCKETNGGTIWNELAAISMLDITRKRVAELFHYMNFLHMN